jgi:hypothetical protein
MKTELQFSTPDNPNHNLSFVKGTWYIRFFQNGKATRKSLATDDVAKARAARDRFITSAYASPEIHVVVGGSRLRGRKKHLPPGRTTPLPPGIAWRKPYVIREGTRIVHSFSTLEEAEEYLTQQKP